jgi:two-component system sensor kinase FixL
MPAAEEGPFTAEERALLNAVAERLGRLVERLTAEAKLKEKEGELRARMTHFSRVNTMGEMASSIAHEVNQPLTAIANYAQACRRLVESGRAEGADVLDVLDRISREALRAGGIIQRLRTLVKRRPGRATECDLVALVREAGTLVAADARLHDVRLDLDLPDTAPVVKCDPIQVQQVLLNLARNGIDAMDGAHDARLAVRVRREAQELVVSVEDRGCGLREGTEEAIFDPFFTTKEGGMGMGLAISRSIVARHGGRLWCAPNPYLGTTFYFTLPLARTADDE